MFFPVILLLLILIIFIITRLKLSLITLISFDSCGFHLEVKVMLYKILTIYKWNLEEGGLSFLFKKKKDVPKKHKKEKGRLAAILKVEFSRDSYHHIKEHLEVFDVTVKGRIATKDAACTAMIYGGIWSILGVLIPFIPQKRIITDFYPDFQKDTPDFHVSCILRVRIIHIIVLVIQNKRKQIREGRSESYGTASY